MEPDDDKENSRHLREGSTRTHLRIKAGSMKALEDPYSPVPQQIPVSSTGSPLCAEPMPWFGGVMKQEKDYDTTNPSSPERASSSYQSSSWLSPDLTKSMFFNRQRQTKKRTPKTLQKLQEKHRNNERNRHHSLNALINQLSDMVPSEAKVRDSKETKVVKMKRAVTYICYLEAHIMKLCDHIGVQLDFENLFLTPHIKDLDKHTLTKMYIPDPEHLLTGRPEPESVLLENEENSEDIPTHLVQIDAERRFKISSPTIDSTTDDTINATNSCVVKDVNGSDDDISGHVWDIVGFTHGDEDEDGREIQGNSVHDGNVEQTQCIDLLETAEAITHLQMLGSYDSDLRELTDALNSQNGSDTDTDEEVAVCPGRDIFKGQHNQNETDCVPQRPQANFDGHALNISGPSTDPSQKRSKGSVLASLLNSEKLGGFHSTPKKSAENLSHLSSIYSTPPSERKRKRKQDTPQRSPTYDELNPQDENGQKVKSPTKNKAGDAKDKKAAAEFVSYFPYHWQFDGMKVTHTKVADQQKNIEKKKWTATSSSSSKEDKLSTSYPGAKVINIPPGKITHLSTAPMSSPTPGKVKANQCASESVPSVTPAEVKVSGKIHQCPTATVTSAPGSQKRKDGFQHLKIVSPGGTQTNVFTARLNLNNLNVKQLRLLQDRKISVTKTPSIVKSPLDNSVKRFTKQMSATKPSSHGSSCANHCNQENRSEFQRTRKQIPIGDQGLEQQGSDFLSPRRGDHRYSLLENSPPLFSPPQIVPQQKQKHWHREKQDSSSSPILKTIDHDALNSLALDQSKDNSHQVPTSPAMFSQSQGYESQASGASAAESGNDQGFESLDSSQNSSAGSCASRIDHRKTSWMNGFMMFSRLNRRKYIQENPGIHTANISKMMGSSWRQMTPEEQQPYKDKARDYTKYFLSPVQFEEDIQNGQG